MVRTYWRTPLRTPSQIPSCIPLRAPFTNTFYEPSSPWHATVQSLHRRHGRGARIHIFICYIYIYTDRDIYIYIYHPYKIYKNPKIKKLQNMNFAMYTKYKIHIWKCLFIVCSTNFDKQKKKIKCFECNLALLVYFVQ